MSGGLLTTGYYLLLCVFLLLLVHRLLCRLSIFIASALVLIPLLPTGRSLVTGGFHGALNATYSTPPLLAQSWRLEETGYQNGNLHDVTTLMFPSWQVSREALRAGRVPFLNHANGMGELLLAAQEAVPFHLFTLLALPLSAAQSWTLALTLKFFFAILFTFLLLRELGVREEIALFGGSVYGLSTFLLFWNGWTMATVFSTWPVVLLGLERLVRRRAHGFALTLLGFLLALLGGHPESTLHTVVASAVLFLTAVLRRFRRAGSRDERLGVLRVVGSATAAGLVAVGLSAPNLFPFLEALPQTLDFQVRHNLYTKATKSLPLADVLGSAVAAVFPGLYGPVWWDPGVVHPPRFDDATGAFIGGLALGLALLGSTSRRPEARPFAILGFVAFVVALGSPGFADALAWFPLFDSAFNQRLSGVSVLCLAALSAFGLELALEDFRGRRSFFFLALGAVLLGAGLILRTRVAHTSHARRFDWEIAFLVLPLLLWAAAARLRHLEWRFPRPSRPFLASLATALFLLPQLGTFPRLYRTFREALVYPEVEELRALPRGGEPFRTFGLGGTLLPMTSVFYGLQDPRRIPVMSNARLLETYPLFADASSWFQRIDDANAPFLAFLNARFAIAPPDAKTPSQWAEVLRGNNCAVLFNPRALPRAFAPKRIRFSGDRARTIAEMKAQDDFEALAWLEPVAIEGGARAGTAYEEQNGPASVTTTAVGDNFLLDIDAAAPSWIVVSQTAWRGWNAMEGRVRYPLYFANNAFLAFKVEGGRHRIALVYCPASFPWGLACAAITLIGLVTVIAISARRLQAEERLTRA